MMVRLLYFYIPIDRIASYYIKTRQENLRPAPTLIQHFGYDSAALRYRFSAK